MVEMFDNRIKITNPGGLPKGLRPEDFGEKSVLRNSNIANLLHRMGYIEKMGTGIRKIRHLLAHKHQKGRQIHVSYSLLCHFTSN